MKNHGQAILDTAEELAENEQLNHRTTRATGIGGRGRGTLCFILQHAINEFQPGFKIIGC